MNITVDFNPFAEGELLLTAPATESQKEIWLSVRMGDDANCSYNESQSLQISGKLNVEVFQNALQELVQRHEALRTTFSPDGNTLCIAPSLSVEIPLFDLSELEPQRDRQVAHLRQLAVEQPFDLEHGPLFRAQIIKLQPEKHLVLLTAHHIICDGWSWGVLMPDLGKIYSALVKGEVPNLGEPDRFSDYAVEQEQLEGSQEAIATVAFWLNQFSQSVPILDLPSDRPRPALRTFNAAREDWTLDPTLVTNLKQIGTKLGCSFMTTMLAAFEVFLYRLTGQEDLVVGIPAAGQAAAGNYNLVGHCVNVLPLHTTVNGSQPFSDYLKQRQSTVLDAYDHQQFTFGSLVKKLAIPRDPSRIPLVPVIFNIDQGLDRDKLPFEGLEVEFFSNPRSFENFEIFVNATELKGKITLECQYNTSLFDSQTIQRRMAEFETLLTGIVTNLDQSIANLPILPEVEQQLLNQWTQLRLTCPQDKCIHELFEAQVERTPETIAVVFEDQKITYQELNRRANQLARYLQNLGVGPEVAVGICADRSLSMIVGILAILKSGGGYVPLDPDYPSDRLTYMLADAKVPVLLSQKHLSSKLPVQDSNLICVDFDDPAIAEQSQDNLVSSSQANNLAYIIYTSGSTGKPKGVLINHSNVIRLFEATQPWYHFNEQDVWTLFHSYAFDFSVWEIWGALLYGGRLVVVPYLVSRSPQDFYTLLCEQQVTVLNQTPSAFRQLIKVDESLGYSHNLHLRLVIFGGEALELQALKPWFERHGDRHPELVNMYGITETTVHVTYRPLRMTDLNGSASLIGCPIPDLQLYLLDRYQQQVPIGVPGEIHVGGAGLARGYLNRPELTAERFIRNPFSTAKNSGDATRTSDRLYKSGDLARYLPNGDIEYLGRIDHQVKIRGFRIELSEIEATLAQHPAVRECVVIVRGSQPDDARIVAYFVSRQDQPPSSSELRRSLKEKLPEYMLPAAFVCLDSMPLTPTGKVDRRALPLPDITRKDLESDYVAPRTDTEQQIAEIWSQVLSVEQIGISDSFFELGGHSVLAIQVISRLRKTFNVQVPLRSLFEEPTVAKLAELVETLHWANHTQQPANADATTDYEDGEL